MKRLLLISLLLLSSVCHAQTDTAFWFAAPDLSRDDRSVRFVFHTYDQSATVTVEQPANSLFTSHTIIMGPHTVSTLDLSPYVDIIETSPINTVLNRGFYIHSTAPITCYYQSTSSNRETYTLKGHNALGTEFFTLSPESFRGNSYPGTGRSLELIATEDSTHINIIPSGPYNLLEGYTEDDHTIEISLNRGQSFAVRGEHYRTSLDRYRIVATKPIAVNFTSNSIWSDPNYRYNNVIGEQILPTRYFGVKYAMIHNFSPNEYFEATTCPSIRNNPTLWYNGDTIVYKTSVWWQTPYYFFTDSITYLKAKYPFALLHQTDPNHQMGGTLLPQLDCSGSHEVSYLRCGDSLSLKIHIIVESHAIADLRFNGSSTVLTASDFEPLPNYPKLSWCAKDVGQYVGANAVMTISCPTGLFNLGVIESDSNRGTSYTYLTDYAPYTSIQFDMDTIYCAGSPIQFRAYNIDSVTVYGPNGLVLTEPPYIIPNADTTMSGTYIVQGFSTESCHDLLTDSIHLHIFIPNQIDIYDTIVENQLPWQCPDATIYAQTDTDFHHPDTLLPCDSIIHYHLHVHHNIHDTLLYYACEGNLPIRYGDTLFTQEGQADFNHRGTGSHGEDSLVTFILHIIPNSDTTIRDSITEDQLPWFALDTVFNDTVADYIYHLYNEAGCDSIIHYNLFIFWNGDHCDTTLSYPNVVTPNGDGNNDRFVIGGLIEHDCFKYNELTIYDRYGHCVYHKRNIATEADWWNPAAQRAPSGTYFYYFKAHGVNIWTQHHGVIEVLRDK